MVEAFMVNFSNATDIDDQKPSKLFTLICAVLVTVFLVIGMLGNLWIAVVILRSREMRLNVINLFIASLCLNDLFSLTCNGMVAISYFAYDWVLSMFLCQMMPEFTMVLICVSLWHHALIALHRYIVVVHRTNSTFMVLHRKLYCGIVLLGTRVFGFLLSVSHPLFNNGKWLGMTVYMVKMLRCIYTKDLKLRILLIVLSTQIIPCLIVIVCFALIFVFVHRAGTRSMVADRILLRREIKITKMFGIVFVMFLVGFIPYSFVRMADSDNSMNANVYVILTVGYAFASCLTPIIFGAMNTEIREACLSVIGRGQATNNRNAVKGKPVFAKCKSCNNNTSDTKVDADSNKEVSKALLHNNLDETEDAPKLPTGETEEENSETKV